MCQGGVSDVIYQDACPFSHEDMNWELAFHDKYFESTELWLFNRE